MTSVAFIMGVLPLVFASGAGFEIRRAMGIAVFAGMLGVTSFGLFLTPLFFTFIGNLLERLKPRKLAIPATAAMLALLVVVPMHAAQPLTPTLSQGSGWRAARGGGERQ